MISKPDWDALGALFSKTPAPESTTAPPSAREGTAGLYGPLDHVRSRAHNQLRIVSSVLKLAEALNRSVEMKSDPAPYLERGLCFTSQVDPNSLDLSMCTEVVAEDPPLTIGVAMAHRLEAAFAQREDRSNVVVSGL